VAFLHQNQYISLIGLYETSDVSTGDVLTVSYAVKQRLALCPHCYLMQFYSLEAVSYSQLM
jgi:hypothetical protein